MLVVKAAVQMHWFGSSYAAGDVIDTTGYDDHAMAQLLKTQPVYVSDTGGGSSAVRLTFAGQTGKSGTTELVPWVLSGTAQSWCHLSGQVDGFSLDDGLYVATWQIRVTTAAATQAQAELSVGSDGDQPDDFRAFVGGAADFVLTAAFQCHSGTGGLSATVWADDTYAFSDSVLTLIKIA